MEEQIDLSRRALILLQLLVEAKGDVVPHKDIYERWGIAPRDQYAWNIHVHISELRKVLGYGYIETKARNGYRIAVKVVERWRPAPNPPSQQHENAITTLWGLNPERLQQMIEAAVTGATGTLVKQIDELTNRLGVTHAAVLTMLRTIGEQEVPLERLTDKLAEIATQYKSAVERMAALDPHDPVTSHLVERARAAM